MLRGGEEAAGFRSIGDNGCDGEKVSKCPKLSVVRLARYVRFDTKR